MQASFWRIRLSPKLATFIAATVLLAGVAWVYFILNQPLGTTGQSPMAKRGALTEGSYPADPLVMGTMSPPLEAGGWLNGPPPVAGAKGSRLIVLDIWSHWCPACRQTAPGLVKLYNKFKHRGVTFVSLTNIKQAGVKMFADQFMIPWACGYEAPLESIARFGAYSTERMADFYNPGYEVSPTLYVIDRDGEVYWNDGQARPRHLKESDEILRDLEAAIERALADDMMMN